MAIKKVQIILIVLSIVISAGIGVLAFNVATQVDEGITSGAQYYSAIVGPAGSNTQLAMNNYVFYRLSRRNDPIFGCILLAAGSAS